MKRAAAKEEGTYLLYKNAADNAKDPHTKTVLNNFADEELKHKQIIENFSGRKPGNTKSQKLLKPLGKE